MKKIGILILGLGLFASVGCGRSKRVAEPDPDGAAISEIGDIYQVEEEPKKKKKSRWGKKKREEKVAKDEGERRLDDEGSATPETREVENPKKPKKTSADLAAEALAAAKVHIELEDYDFAGDELRKIAPGSPLYQEAQRLLEAYR